MEKVRLLQKRARDKEYRMRKQGAPGTKVGSPRLNFSEVRGMNDEDLREYERSLRKFTKTRLTVLPSGDVVETKKLARMRKNIKIHNEKVEKARKKLLDKAKGSKPSRLPESLKPISIREKPKTAREVDRLLEKSEKWRRIKPTKVMSGQRRSAVAMLRQVGLDREAGIVSNMRWDQLMQLLDADLLDDLALWYHTDASETEREINYNPDDFAIFESRLRDTIGELRGGGR